MIGTAEVRAAIQGAHQTLSHAGWIVETAGPGGDRAEIVGIGRAKCARSLVGATVCFAEIRRGLYATSYTGCIVEATCPDEALAAMTNGDARRVGFALIAISPSIAPANRVPHIRTSAGDGTTEPGLIAITAVAIGKFAEITVVAEEAGIPAANLWTRVGGAQVCTRCAGAQ